MNDPTRTFPNAFFVRGVTADGVEVYYTGRAGDGWVSADGNMAFRYDSREAAQRKALAFNRMTAVHGLRFVATGRND